MSEENKQDLKQKYTNKPDAKKMGDEFLDLKENAQKELIAKKYKDQGFQQVSYKEYMALKAAKAKHKKFGIPKPLVAFLKIPVFLLCLFGICYLPYILCLILMNPYVGYNVPKEDTSTKAEKIQESRYKHYLKSKDNED